MQTYKCGSVWLVIAVLAGGCGAEAEAVTPRATMLPPTDADPSAWLPPPVPEPQAGRVVGISMSGGYDQARATAIQVIEAIRDADGNTLERLLAPRVGRTFPRLANPNRSRADVVNTVLRNPRRGGLGPDTPLEDLVDQASMRVIPLTRHSDTVPHGLATSDLLVELPLLPAGRRWFRFILGWSTVGRLVIRPGTEPQVIAL